MTSKERVMNFIEGKEVDRIPNLNIVMLFAAEFGGIPYSEFCFIPEKMAKANIKTAREFGIDVLTIMSDPYTEANDFGTQLIRVHDDLPYPKEDLLQDLEDVKTLHIVNPEEGERMSLRLQVIREYKKQVGDEFPIIGWVEGPIAEASDLRGINNAMMDIIMDETGLFDQLLDIVTDQAIVFAKAQLEAGADFIGIGDAAASLLSADLYREKILPRTKRIVDAIHDAGGKTKLHICGNINHLLEDLTTLGVTILDIDYMVDMERAVSLFEGISIINGNVNPVATMLEGDINLVQEDVVKTFQNSHGKACISCGCEVPRMTPKENMKAFDEQVRKLKR